MIERMQAFVRRLVATVRRDALDRDLRDELASHVDHAIEDNLRLGLSPEEARRRALIRLGAVPLAEETHRDARGLPFLDRLSQDLRHALRTMKREPGIAALSVVILALAIGANTAVFSVVNTILLRPLPFPAANELVWFSSGRDSIARGRDVGGLSGVTYTVDAFEEFQRGTPSFSAVTAYDPFLGDAEFTMVGTREPEHVAAVRIARNFFQTLGVAPAHGRDFAADECRKGGPGAVILSYAFWQQHFHGDPAVIGRAVRLGSASTTIVGVMPEEFDFGAVFAPGVRIDAYVPAVMDDLRTWGNTLAIVGRLKPGVDLPRAQAESDVVFQRLKEAHKDWWGDYSSTLSGLKDHVMGHLRRALVFLWAAVGTIMLIASVNLSNLLLARTTARSREFAMRTALGATRRRLTAQLVTESLVLSSFGAIAGIGVAVAITSYLARHGSLNLPLLSSIRVDGVALLWTIVVALAAALVFGTLPGLKLASGNVQQSLTDSARGSTAGPQHETLRAALVVAEIALACVLLVGSGLLLRSLLRVLDVDLGFRPAQAATIPIDYDAGPDGKQRAAALQRIVDAVRAIPGVEAAGFTDMLPLGRDRSWGFGAKGRTYERPDDTIVMIRVVTPGYITAMGMRLVAGRDFDWQDGTKGHLALIVNEAAARRHWGRTDAAGQIAMLGKDVEARVVGVVADVRQQSAEGAVGPEMFQPVTQADPEGAELVVRSARSLDSLTIDVMRTLRANYSGQPAAALTPVQAIVDRSVSSRRFFAVLVASFAALGLLLAALGIYGVISYNVAQRRPEIGIRMALGATAEQVRRDVMTRTLRLVSGGVALGALGALVVGRSMAAMLFDTAPTDSATFASIALLLGGVSLLAGYIPAFRASRADPMTVLRDA
jgi:predicted permease